MKVGRVEIPTWVYVLVLIIEILMILFNKVEGANAVAFLLFGLLALEAV